jgi:hypothetical protein
LHKAFDWEPLGKFAAAKVPEEERIVCRSRYNGGRIQDKEDFEGYIASRIDLHRKGGGHGAIPS